MSGLAPWLAAPWLFASSIVALALVVLALGLAGAWAAAAILFPPWVLVARRFRGLARASVVVACLPALAGLAVAAAALLPGDPHLNQLLACHCGASMPNWQHLCPVHPASAAPLLPIAALVLAVLLPGRLRVLRALTKEPLGRGGAGTPTILDLPVPTATLWGWLRPSLVVDRQLWEALDTPQRAAVLAHERAHLARRDPGVLMLLRVLVSVGPPRAGRDVVRTWLSRAERRADAVAARHVGDPLIVADALLRCARLGVVPSPMVPAWTGGELEARIGDLLDRPDPAATAAPDGGWLDLVLVGSLGAAVIAATPWLHHQLEHILNLSL